MSSPGRKDRIKIWRHRRGEKTIKQQKIYGNAVIVGIKSHCSFHSWSNKGHSILDYICFALGLLV